MRPTTMFSRSLGTWMTCAIAPKARSVSCCARCTSNTSSITTPEETGLRPSRSGFALEVAPGEDPGRASDDGGHVEHGVGPDQRAGVMGAAERAQIQDGAGYAS